MMITGMFNGEHRTKTDIVDIRKSHRYRAFPTVSAFPDGYELSEYGEAIDEFEDYNTYCEELIAECDNILKETYSNDYYGVDDSDFDDEISMTSVVKSIPDVCNSVSSSPPLLGKSANMSPNKRPNAYDLCQDFLKTHSVKNYGGLLYLYTEPCYSLLTQDLAKCEILDNARDIIGNYGSSDLLRQAYGFLRAESSLMVSDEYEDSSYVVFRNGRINLDTEEFENNDPSVFAITYLNINYCQGTDCPVFKKYLCQISGDNERLMKRIWEIIGYCWSADMRAKAMFLFMGKTGTGKSTLLKVIRSALVMNEGECTISIHNLGARFALANLIGKRLISDGDFGDIPLSPQNVAIIKSLTGLDSIRSEKKGVDALTIRPTAKLVVCSNTTITLRKPDNAFEDRVVVVPFENQIAEKDRDPNLFDKLQKELPAIANVAFEHYLKLRRKNYHFTELDYDVKSIGQTNTHLQRVSIVDNDSIIMDFFYNCCKTDDGKRELTEDLFRAYVAYCKERELPHTNKTDFSTRFGRLTCLDKKKIGKQNGYVGVSLKSI